MIPASQRKKLELFVEQAKQRRTELKNSFFFLQDSLNCRRLSIKYLFFDLEATRREQLYLRKMLEETAK
jgi:hypothetical protein